MTNSNISAVIGHCTHSFIDQSAFVSFQSGSKITLQSCAPPAYANKYELTRPL